MHVVLVTYHFLPRIGGVEIATHQLATALRHRGLEVSVVAPSEPPEGKVLYRYVRLPRWRGGVPRPWRTWAALFQLYRRHPFQILLAQMLYPAGYDTCRFGRWARVPVVVLPQGADIHVYEPLSYGIRLKGGVERRLRTVVRCASALTVSSELMRRELTLVAAEAASKSSFVPNGTVLEHFRGWDRCALRRQFGVEAEETVFITVSRHSPIKGVSILLEAARQLAREQPQGWRLWIAGMGMARLQEQVRELPQIELLGEFPQREYDERGFLRLPSILRQRLCAADVYVAPALSGGFELSCADALAAGLPVIVCRTNGTQDTVRAHGAGLTIPPADPGALREALRWMLSHAEERRAMSQRARQAAEGLDWGVVAQHCDRICQWVLQGKGTPWPSVCS